MSPDLISWLRQPTVWAMKHKIMAVTARREGEMRLGGRVEMDDGRLGSRRSGRRGRGAAGKTPFVAAVSTGAGGVSVQAQAGSRQGLPKARDRARRPTLAGAGIGGRHRWSRLP